MPARNQYVAGGSLAVAGAALVATWLFFQPGQEPVPATVDPVMVGGDTEFDACATQGITFTPETPVHAGPDESFPQLDTLPPGAPINLCDYSADAAWVAVVYPPPETPDADCGVSTPIAIRAPYAGSCRAGWIRAVSVNPLAG